MFFMRGPRRPPTRIEKVQNAVEKVFFISDVAVALAELLLTQGRTGLTFDIIEKRQEFVGEVARGAFEAPGHIKSVAKEVEKKTEEVSSKISADWMLNKNGFAFDFKTKLALLFLKNSRAPSVTKALHALPKNLVNKANVRAILKLNEKCESLPLVFEKLKKLNCLDQNNFNTVIKNANQSGNIKLALDALEEKLQNEKNVSALLNHIPHLNAIYQLLEIAKERGGLNQANFERLLSHASDATKILSLFAAVKAINKIISMEFALDHVAQAEDLAVSLNCLAEHKLLGTNQLELDRKNWDLLMDNAHVAAEIRGDLVRAKPLDQTTFEKIVNTHAAREAMFQLMLGTNPRLGVGSGMRLFGTHLDAEGNRVRNTPEGSVHVLNELRKFM